MKKMLSVILILILALTTATTVAIATSSKVELSSRTATNDAIGVTTIKGNDYYFEYLVWEHELSKLDYVEVEPTKWDGLFLVGNKTALIGVFYPEDKPLEKKGPIYEDNTKLALDDVLRKGAFDYRFVIEGLSKGMIDTYSGRVHVRIVKLTGENHNRLVVTKPAGNVPTATPTPYVKPTQKPTAKPTVVPTEVPTVAPTVEHTKVPTAAPVTPRVTPNPTLVPTPEPRVTPNPVLVPTDTPVAIVTPAPRLQPTEHISTPVPHLHENGEATPRPVKIDTNPTLTPEQEDLLDFVDYPTEVPAICAPAPHVHNEGTPTPRPVLVDTNPTLAPEQEDLLDFD